MAAVTSPNLGLILDKPPIDVPKRGLQDGLNFRVKNGTLESINLGWTDFAAVNHWALNGPVYLIDNFFPRDGAERLIFGSDTDLYVYDSVNDNVLLITPVKQYTGTVAYTNGSAEIVGTGTAFVDDLKEGDMIVLSLASADYTNPYLATSVGWYTIDTITDQTHLTLTTVVTAATDLTGDMTVRLRFTGGTMTEWSTAVFLNDGVTGTDLWIATNGLEPIVSWDGTDPVALSHTELGFTAKALATYSNMMIYGNIEQGGTSLPTTIINSDIGKPLLAGATGTGLSEQFVVHSGSNPILTMMPINDYLAIYTRRKIINAQFVGDPLVFEFRVAVTGYGPVSSNAVVDFGGYHEFVGADAGYMFDGVTLKETSPHVWRNILRQADPARRVQVFAHRDEEQGDLIWSIPATTDAGAGEVGEPADVAWVEHYLEDTGQALIGSPFSRRAFPFTTTGYYERKSGRTWNVATIAWEDSPFRWDDQALQLAFPLNLAGDTDGKVWTLNTSQKAEGTAILPSYVRTGRRAMRSGRERDILTRVYPFTTTQPNNLEVSLYMGDFVSGAVSAKGTRLYDMNNVSDRHFVTFFRRGRVLELKFGSETLGEPWVLTGWDYDTKPGGTR